MKKRIRSTIFTLIFALGLAGATGALGYLAQANHIKVNGIVLTPTKDIPLIQETHYLQNDNAWSQDLMGDSGITLGSQGCLVSSVATAIKAHGESDISPGVLNTLLTENGGYDNAMLIWYKINEILPEFDYRYTRIFSAKTIENDLSLGLLPAVKVQFKGTGMSHWVLICGAENGEFMVYDPLYEGEPIPLATHGNVYAYRVIQRTGTDGA